MKKLLLIILAFSMQVTAYAQDGFSTLEERMTGKEFKETGLVKLTDQELATLNEWLRSHSVATLENASSRSTAAAASAASASTTEDTRGFVKKEEPNPLGDEINSSIVGTFDGWEGKGTVFRLANGMVWQQVEKDTFYVKPLVNPEVTIKKGFTGKWRLSLVGHNSSVKVQRIQ